MSRRTSPIDVIVAFFETAPLEQAQTVLTIARGILTRRTPKAKAAKPGRKPAPLTDNDRQIIDELAEETRCQLRQNAETVPAHVKTTRGGLPIDDLERP